MNGNHIARNGVSIFRNLNSFAGLVEKVKVVRAWESRDLVITGVPPHIKQIVDLEKLRESSASLPETVTKMVMTDLTIYLESKGIGGGELTEARLKEMIDSTAGACVRNVEKKLDDLKKAFETASGQRNRILLDQAGEQLVVNNEERNERDRESYPLRMRKGLLTRLPEDFEFPSSTAWDCWERWNVGNKERGVPPLRFVRPDEYTFMDAKDKHAIQRRTAGGTGQHGVNQTKRRPCRKLSNDLAILCNYIEKKAGEAGYNTSDRSTFNMTAMWNAAGIHTLVTSKRKDQLSWQTVLKYVRKRIKADKNNT